MAMRIAGIVLVVLLVVVLVWRPQPMASCGGFFETYVFTWTVSFSLKDAAGGGWDVLQPAYRHTGLILAYRYLSGVKLTAEELKVLAPEPRLLTQEEALDSWPPGVNMWLRTRKKVPSAPPVERIDPYRPVGQFQSFHNCLEDSFRTAARTLDARIQQFGAGSRAVAEWLQAQDQVFQNCSGQKGVFPPPVAADLPALIRADRAYQTAAARFYAGDLEDAVRLFREIAADASSPWSGVAPYVVARCLIRQGTVSGGGPTVAMEKLSQAETQLQGILADGSRQSWHEPARKLMGFVRARLRPEEQRVALGQALVKPGASEGLARSLEDYHFLLDRLPAVTAAGDDLTDWVLTFKAQGREALEHSHQRWKTTSSLPWLVAAITKVPAQDPRAEELLGAAAAVKPGSPAFASVAFHGVRLLAGSGRQGEARARLDALLSPAFSGFSASARNLFKAQRMMLARGLDEFLRDAARQVVAKGDGFGYEYPSDPARDPAVLFDADAARVLNEQVPLSELERAASRALLPGSLRRQVALAAWVRAVLLEDDKVVQSLARTSAELTLDLRPQFEAFLKSASSEDRRFAAAYLLLQTPGLRPYVPAVLQRRTPAPVRLDSVRDNWWCSFGEMDRPPGGGWNYYERCCTLSTALQPVYPEARVEAPVFLTKASRAAAAAEWKKLQSLPTAPNYLAAQAIAYARNHPNDPRVPESLHLAVRATRYGCTDVETGKFSKQAFDLLHQRYPKSPWAEKTPYWYR
jgi:hypothetical protein